MAIEMRQDGGWAWCICIGSFVVNFVGAAFLNCGGVVLSALVDNFNIPRSEAAWVTSLPASCVYLFAPLSTFCCNRYGARWTVTMGTIIAVFSLLMSSFATNVKILYFSYGISGGLGTSLLYYPNYIMMSKYFKKRISTANGIATSGASVGTFVFSPVMQQLFTGLGLGNGLRALAGFHVILIVPVLLYRPLEGSPEAEDTPENTKWFGTEVFKNRSFILWLVAVFLFQLNYMVPYIHLVRLGEDVGATKVTASLLISILAGGSFVGRTLCGRLADLACCNRQRILQGALLCIAVSTSLVAFATSFELVAVYAAVFGICDGVYIMAFMVITRDIVGNEYLSFALGVAYCIMSIPKTLGPLLAGLLFDLAQNYVLPFTLMGALTACSSLLIFLVGIKRSSKLLSCFIKEREENKENEVIYRLEKREQLTMDVQLCKETVV